MEEVWIWEAPGGISVYVLRHSTVPVTFVPPRTTY